MSENNEAGSFATAGSGKSEAEVAFDLLSKLKGQGVWGERNLGAILDMYAECLDAAKGFRAYEGQNKVDVPVSKAQATQQVQPTAQTAPQPQATAQLQQAQPPVQAQATQTAQPVQPQQAQPVHAQQQVLQQAYKQG